MEIKSHSFQPLRQYGFEFQHRLPSAEAAFYIRYLALLLPAGLFLALGLAFAVGRAPFVRLFDRVAGVPERTFGVSIAVLAALLVLGGGLVVLRNQPITDDEQVYTFQSDLLSRGKLFTDSYPMPEFFDNVSVINNGKWYGKYPPGHSLALVPGTAVGFPRLVPILLAALNIWLFYRLAVAFLRPRAARAAAILLLLSPFYLLTGATLLAHSSTLAGLLVMALGVVHARRTQRLSWSVLAGAGAAFAFICRPYTTVLIGLPIAAAWGVDILKRRGQRRPWVVAAAVALVGPALLLATNALLTGNPLKTPYSQITGGKVLGFGQVVPGQIVHTPLEGVLNVGLTIVRLNFWTWGWPLSWLFVIAALLWARQDRLKVLWAILVTTGLGGILYVSMGVGDTGPVKYYELLPALALLTVAGVEAFDARVGTPARPGVSAVAPALLVVFTLLGWGFFARIQAQELHRVTGRIAAPYSLVDKLEEHKLLVFTGSMAAHPQESWVTSAPNNLPDNERRVLYIRDLGLKNRQLMSRYPDRVPYALRIDPRGGKWMVVRLTGDEATRRAADEHIRQGIQEIRNKRTREAILAFIEATKADPDYAKAHLLLGWAFEQALLDPQADIEYHKALELDPDQVDHYFFLGRFLARHKRFDEALPVLEKAREMDPRSADIQQVLDQCRHRIAPP